MPTIDDDKQAAYAELRRRGYFKSNPDAAAAAQELVKRGVLRDLSGGSQYAAPKPAPAASPSPWGTDEETQGQAPTIGQVQAQGQRKAAKRITPQGETAAGTVNPVFGAALQVARGQKSPTLPIAPRHDNSSISQGENPANFQETQKSMQSRLGQAARQAKFGSSIPAAPTHEQLGRQLQDIQRQVNPGLYARMYGAPPSGAAIADLSPDEQMRVDRANLTGLAPEHRGFSANMQDMRERRKAASEAVQNSILPLGAALLTGGAGAALELPALLTGAGAIGVGALAGKGQDALNQAIDPEEFRRQQERAAASEEKDPFGAILFQNIAGLPFMGATPLAERAAGAGLNALIGTGLDAGGRFLSGQPQNIRKSLASGLIQGIINPELPGLPIGRGRGEVGGAVTERPMSQQDRIQMYDLQQQRRNGLPTDLSYLTNAVPSETPRSAAAGVGDVPGALYANQAGTANVAGLGVERAPRGTQAPVARPAASSSSEPVYIPVTSRQELAQALADPRTFGYRPDFAGRVADVYHSVATQWAKDNARPVEDWYAERMDSIAGGGERLAQELAKRAGKAATGQEKGATFFNGKNSRAIVAALSSPDESTALHELGHVLWQQMSENGNGPIKAGDFDRLGAFYGVEPGQTWTVGQKEAFARSMEHFFSTGEAPNPSLKPAFTAFKQALSRIYNAVKSAGMAVIGRRGQTRGVGWQDTTPFSPEIKAMMDRYFGDISSPEAQPTERSAVQSSNERIGPTEQPSAPVRATGTGTAGAEVGQGVGGGSAPRAAAVATPRLEAANGVGAEGGSATEPTVATGGRGRGADYGRESAVGSRRPVRLVDGVPAPPEELATPEARQAARSELLALREKVLTKGGNIKARASAADVGRYHELLLMGDEFQAFKRAKAEYDARGASDEAGQATAPASAVSALPFNRPAESLLRAASDIGYDIAKVRQDAESIARRMGDDTVQEWHVAEATQRPSATDSTDNASQYEVPAPEPSPLDLDTSRPVADVAEDVLRKNGYGQQETPRTAPASNRAIPASQTEAGTVRIPELRTRAVEEAFKAKNPEEWERLADHLDAAGLDMSGVRHAIEDYRAKPQNKYRAARTALSPETYYRYEVHQAFAKSRIKKGFKAPQVAGAAQAAFNAPAPAVREAPAETRALVQKAIQWGRDRIGRAENEYKNYSLDSYDEGSGNARIVSPRQDANGNNETYDVNVKTGYSSDPDSQGHLTRINQQLADAGIRQKVVSKHVQIARRLIEAQGDARPEPVGDILFQGGWEGGEYVTPSGFVREERPATKKERQKEVSGLAELSPLSGGGSLNNPSETYKRIAEQAPLDGITYVPVGREMDGHDVYHTNAAGLIGDGSNPYSFKKEDLQPFYVKLWKPFASNDVPIDRTTPEYRRLLDELARRGASRSDAERELGHPHDHIFGDGIGDVLFRRVGDPSRGRQMFWDAVKAAGYDGVIAKSPDEGFVVRPFDDDEAIPLEGDTATVVRNILFQGGKEPKQPQPTPPANAPARFEDSSEPNRPPAVGQFLIDPDTRAKVTVDEVLPTGDVRVSSSAGGSHTVSADQWIARRDEYESDPFAAVPGEAQANPALASGLARENVATATAPGLTNRAQRDYQRQQAREDRARVVREAATQAAAGANLPGGGPQGGSQGQQQRDRDQQKQGQSSGPMVDIGFEKKPAPNPGYTPRRVAAELINAPRTLMAGGDLSFVGRQGLMLGINYPKEAGQAAVHLVRALVPGGAKRAEAMYADIKANPLYSESQKAGLYLSHIAKENGSLAGREEDFASSFVSRIPGIRNVERANTAYLDSLRFGAWKRAALAVDRQIAGEGVPKFAENLPPKVKEALGYGTDLNREAEMAKIARYVNYASGRGDLGKFGESFGDLLGGALFSPKFVASRYQVFADPRLYSSQTPATRRMIVANNVKYAAAVMAMLTLAKANGAEVETDPEKADFGKIKIGNTRYQVDGGVVNNLRFTLRMMRAVAQPPTQEELRSHKRRATGEIVGQYLRGKLSPMAGVVSDRVFPELAPDRFEKPKPTFGQKAFQMVTPMIAKDFGDVLKDQGSVTPKAAATGALTAFGVGTQTYTPSTGSRGSSSAVSPLLKPPAGLGTGLNRKQSSVLDLLGKKPKGL